jgi:hypothetical protein
MSTQTFAGTIVNLPGPEEKRSIQTGAHVDPESVGDRYYSLNKKNPFEGLVVDLGAEPYKLDPPDPAPFDMDRYAKAWLDLQPQSMREYQQEHFAGFVAEIARPFKSQGYVAMSAWNRGWATFLTHLDLATKFLERNGIGERGGIWEELADRYEQNANYWAHRASAVGIGFVDELVGEAIGGAIPSISQFMLDMKTGLTTAYMAGSQAGYENGQRPLESGLVEAAKTGVLGGVFKMTGPLRTYLRSASLGTVGAIEGSAEAPEGQKLKAAIKGGVTMGAFGLTSPGGRLGLNEIWRDGMDTIIAKNGSILGEKGKILKKSGPTLLNDESGFLLIPEIKEFNERFEYGMQRIFNRFQSLENLDPQVNKLGIQLQPGESPKLLSRGYLGNVRRAQSIVEDKTFQIGTDGKIVITGEGFKPILRDYVRSNPKGETYEVAEQEFNQYFEARRTIEDLQRPKNERTTENIATPQQVADARADLLALETKYGNLDHFKAIEDRIYDFQKRVLHQLVDSGNLSEAQYQAIIVKNPHYVPFKRVMDEIESVGAPASKADKPFTEARTPTQRIKGSEREVENLIGSIMGNVYRITDVAARNTVTRGVGRLAKKETGPVDPATGEAPTVGEALGIEHVAPDMKPIKIGPPEVPTEGTIFRPEQPKGTIAYYEDGKVQYMKVKPNLYEAMTGLNEVSLPLLVKWFSAPTSWLRRGVTLTPEYMVRNGLRDNMTAMIQSAVGFRPLIDPVSVVSDILGRTDLYYDYLRSGAAHSGFVELSRTNLNKMAKNLGKDPSKWRYLNIIEDLAKTSEVIELSTRLGVFERARTKAGKSDLEAGFETRESTVDFGVHGSSKSIRMASSLTAFLNPTIQGTSKFFRAHAQNPVGMTVKAVVGVTIPSILLWMANKDDENYREKQRWQKDLFWQIPKTDMQLPKPMGVGQIYGASVERFLDWAYDKDSQAFKDFEKTLLESVAPVQGDPTGIFLFTFAKPVVENEVNFNFFREAPVVSESKERFMPELQFGKYTSQTSRVVGKALGYSPAKIDNLVRAWTGGMGMYGLDATDMLIEAYTGEKSKKRPTENADYPLLKAFFSRPAESNQKSLTDFYDYSEKLEKAYNTYKEYIQKENNADAERVLKQNPFLLQSPVLQSQKDTISTLNKYIDAFVESDMPEENKKKAIQVTEKLRMIVSQSGVAIATGDQPKDNADKIELLTSQLEEFAKMVAGKPEKEEESMEEFRKKLLEEEK